MSDFTEAETDRQDVVDNACHQLLCTLAGVEELDWDIEHISEVREAAQTVICEKLTIMPEIEFYPYKIIE